MNDRQLIEDLLSALEYHTEQTRPIQFSKVAIEAAREYLRKPEQPAQQDIPDLIAGALGVSRGTAYDMMREALAEQSAQQTCNCRWEGEVQVQQCTLHEAHVDAIHEWAGRAKAAEAKLAEQPAQQEPLGYIAIMALNDLQASIYGDVAVYGEDLEDTVAIYTTPQAQPAREWVGLTKEDKAEIVAATERDDRGYVMALVEAKLMEKNT